MYQVVIIYETGREVVDTYLNEEQTWDKAMEKRSAGIGICTTVEAI